jgi:hypothetical protein
MAAGTNAKNGYAASTCFFTGKTKQLKTITNNLGVGYLRREAAARLLVCAAQGACPLKLKFWFVLVLFALPAVAFGQADKPAAGAGSPAARPADVASRDAIVAALYDVISGPAGERDWNRFRSLFIPEAQLIASHQKKEGSQAYKAVSVQGYIDGAEKYFKENGFFEREISRKVESFGSITQIFSTYESRNTADGKPFERGINSIQLWNDGTRWWVVDVYWTGETPETPIPERYLSKSE